jgi:hypothetical protein
VAERRIDGPDGATWTVRRRVLPWRRPISLREMLHSPSDAAAADADDAAPAEETKEPGIVLQVLQLTVGVVLWLAIGAGKLVFYSLAVVLVLAIWLVDAALQLLVLPLMLVARVCGLARWPVQVEREYKHVRTEYADGFAAAETLRDELSAQVAAGAITAPAEAD